MNNSTLELEILNLRNTLRDCKQRQERSGESKIYQELYER